ncbi:MAG: YaaL family protein [Lysinibacillus sp.]|nr:YaaL family protein [Lysinibacillus sp.]
MKFKVGLFSRKGKLKKEFDDMLILLMKETKDDWNNAKILEELTEDYNLDVITQTKIAESLHFYLFKEARIRKIMMH